MILQPLKFIAKPIKSLYILNHKFQKRYKRDAINIDLYRSCRIRSNFYHEKIEIRNKSSTAQYPIRFLNSVINDFESKEHYPVITNYLLNDLNQKLLL